MTARCGFCDSEMPEILLILDEHDGFQCADETACVNRFLGRDDNRITVETTDFLGFSLGERSLRVHSPDQCTGRPCVIHSPSDHHMRDWPMQWRADKYRMDRRCEHDCYHPDPDHMAYVRSLTPEHDCDDDCEYPHLEWQSVHGCCPERCCFQRPPA